MFWIIKYCFIWVFIIVVMFKVFGWINFIRVIVVVGVNISLKGMNIILNKYNYYLII